MSRQAILLSTIMRARILRPIMIGLILLLTNPIALTAEAEPESSHVLIFAGHHPISTSFSGFGTATGHELDVTSAFPADLETYACVLLPGNADPFTPDQVNQLVAYMHAGGTVIAIADQQAFANTITTMNALLVAIDSGIRIEPAAVGFLRQTTTVIEPSAYTTGVSSILYAATSTLSIDGQGQALVRTQDGQAFIGAESVGQGLLVVSGDMNVFYTGVYDPYSLNDGNRVLAANLCQFRGSSGPQAISVAMRPYDTPTVIVAHSKAILHVTVFGSADFDTTSLDLSTMRLGPGMAVPETQGGHLGKFQDENEDGFIDLRLKFRADETGLEPGDTEVCLIGNLTDGTEVEGCTSVQVKGKS